MAAIIQSQVFIVYAHNPKEYTQLRPPEGAELETSHVQRAFLEKAKLHDEEIRDSIRQREKLVKTFATFLERNGVDAVLDQHITDEGTDNRMKWAQDKIEGSRFVILIISESFLPFLEGKPRPPVDKEFIFSNDYLYNKIHFPGECGPKFLPVFLNQKKDHSLLPKALMASTVYEIHEREVSGTSPLDTSKCSEDLLSLYCRITGQTRYSRPAIGAPVIPVPLARIPFGPKPGMTEQQRTKFDCLSKLNNPLLKPLQSKLAESEAFSKHWREIGSKLGLTPVELAQCEQYGDTSERCYQMFEVVGRTGVAGVSVAKLVEAARQIEQYQLFEVIQMYLEN